MGALPKVTVVVPVKNRPGSILATVNSLLRQDYQGEFEVIVVGDCDDPTWTSLESIRDPRLQMIGVVAPVRRRDANYKRNVGALTGTGHLLAFTESDATVPPTWISSGVTQLIKASARDTRVRAVAGLIDSIGTDFWSRYVDGNVFGAKLPRIKDAYVTRAETFGQSGMKPPASGNLFVTYRAFVKAGGFDELQSRYEDYNFAWRLCSAGYHVFHTPEPVMIVSHQHRAGIGLVREYLRSGKGCGQFIQRCAASPLAAQRKRQLRIWATGVIVALLTVLAVPITATPLIVAAGLTAIGLSTLGVIEALRLRRFEALIYPTLTLFMGSVFTLGIALYKDLGEAEVNLVETEKARRCMQRQSTPA